MQVFLLLVMVVIMIMMIVFSLNIMDLYDPLNLFILHAPDHIMSGVKIVHNNLLLLWHLLPPAVARSPIFVQYMHIFLWVSKACFKDAHEKVLLSSKCNNPLTLPFWPYACFFCHHYRHHCWCAHCNDFKAAHSWSLQSPAGWCSCAVWRGHCLYHQLVWHLVACAYTPKSHERSSSLGWICSLFLTRVWKFEVWHRETIYFWDRCWLHYLLPSHPVLKLLPSESCSLLQGQQTIP